MLLLLAGSLRYIKPLQKRLSIAASDERIQIIKGRAFESAYAAALLAGTAAVVILGFFGEPYYYISFASQDYCSWKVLYLALQKLYCLIKCNLNYLR